MREVNASDIGPVPFAPRLDARPIRNQGTGLCIELGMDAAALTLAAVREKAKRCTARAMLEIVALLVAVPAPASRECGQIGKEAAQMVDNPVQRLVLEWNDGEGEPVDQNGIGQGGRIEWGISPRSYYTGGGLRRRSGARARARSPRCAGRLACIRYPLSLFLKFSASFALP